MRKPTYRCIEGHAYIPAHIREALGWRDREDITIEVVEGGTAVLIRRSDIACDFCGAPIRLPGGGSTIHRGRRTLRLCNECLASAVGQALVPPSLTHDGGESV